MLAEIIAIGDELTSGERLDTNSQWLSQQLSRLGITVRWHTAVGDEMESIVTVIQTAAARADLLLITGGLGPTADDLTRPAVAAAAGVDLQLNERQLERIEQLFTRRGRPMSPRNRVQAELPVGAQAIDNPHGSAPGIDFTFRWNADDRTSRLFALPGVPAEMMEMFTETVEPALRTMLGDHVSTISHYCLKCFGMGESDLEAMLPDLIRRGRDPQVGITVHQATITLRITAAGASEAECREKMQSTIEVIHDSLGTLVFGEHNDELQHTVLRQLQFLGRTIAVADAGSGGLLSQWLHEADPLGGTYRGGLVLNAPDALASLNLGPLDHSKAESQAAQAAAMARHAREYFGADYGLALGSYPPATHTTEQSQFVGMAFESEMGAASQAKSFAGHPEVRGPRAAKQALDLLRLHLIERRCG